MKSSTYDKLKFLAQVLLPALITFYGVVGVTWGVPNTEAVLATAVGFNALLGAVLAKSSADYYKEQSK